MIQKVCAPKAGGKKPRLVLVADENIWSSTGADRNRRMETKGHGQVQVGVIDNVNSGSSEQLKVH